MLIHKLTLHQTPRKNRIYTRSIKRDIYCVVIVIHQRCIMNTFWSIEWCCLVKFWDHLAENWNSSCIVAPYFKLRCVMRKWIFFLVCECYNSGCNHTTQPFLYVSVINTNPISISMKYIKSYTDVWSFLYPTFSYILDIFVLKIS